MQIKFQRHSVFDQVQKPRSCEWTYCQRVIFINHALQLPYYIPWISFLSWMTLTTFNLIRDFEGALVIKKIKIKKTDQISLSLFVRIFQAERKKL